MKKNNLIASIFGLKCPSCRSGAMFEGSAFSFGKNAFEMHKFCPKCRQNLEPEIGFYYGAMFISYGITGWFSVLFVMLLHWYWKLGIYTSFFILIAFLALNYVWIFRFSRCLWAHIIIKYGSHRANDN